MVRFLAIKKRNRCAELEGQSDSFQGVSADLVMHSEANTKDSGSLELLAWALLTPKLLFLRLTNC